MSIRVGILASAVALMASISLVPDVASATPSWAAVATKNSSTAHALEVRWRRGWGWGAGAGIIGGVIIAPALPRPYYYDPYYPRAYYYYPGPIYYPDRYYYPRAYRGVRVYEDLDDADAEAYCIQRFRSYDPETGTYLGYDGHRHPCP
jgi:hypothetical protein